MRQWSDHRSRSWKIRVAAAVSLLVMAGVAAIVVLGADKPPTLGAVLVQESVTETGYTARVVLTNTATEIVDGWAVELEMPDGTTIARHWEADMTSEGSRHTFANEAHNGRIEPGEMASFGFITEGSGTPVDCRVNGSACVAPNDTVAPATPANLRASTATVSSVSLSWDAASDDVGVVAYRIYGAADEGNDSNAPMLAATGQTETTVSGLTPGTSYSFAVSAVDAAGNESALGDPLTISTAAGDDTTRPSPPTDIRVKAKTASTVELAWKAADDDRTVAEYRVYEGADVVAVSTSLAVLVSGLKPGTTHKYEVTAADESENESPKSDPVTVSTSPANEQAPTPAPRTTTTTVAPSPSTTPGDATPPDDAVGGGVLISKGRTATASSEGETADGKPEFGPERALDGDPTTRWASKRRIDPSWLQIDLGATARVSRVKLVWDLSCATQYSIEVSPDGEVWKPIYTTTKGDGEVDDLAVGGAGRYLQIVGRERCRPDWGYSLQEVEVYGTLDSSAKDGGDTQPPTAPTELTASDVTESGVTLAWTVATDSGGLAGYDIYHDGNLLRTVDADTTEVTLTDLAPNTRYRITVLARDEAGNASSASNMVTVTTEGDGDTIPPDADGPVRATSVTAASVTLEWDPAEDSGDEISYDVYVGGAKVGTVTGTCVVLTGLAANTAYQFHIKARDAAGNNSPASNTIQVKTRSNSDPEPSPTAAQGQTLPPPPAPGGPASAGGTRIGEVTTVAGDMRIPWGVTFLPTGDALVAERDTFAIYRVEKEGDKTRVGQVPGVSDTGGEGGLLGLALSPNYASDKLLFAYHSTGSDNRVVRMRYENDRLGQPEVILSKIPRNRFHNGGRIIFGPDKLLYIGTGDAQSSANAQNRSSLGGKILRVTAAGKPAPGNPFNSAVFSYGHRNVQGLWFDSRGRLWASEFGDSDRDEVNLITAGKNYGWPECEGPCGQSGFVDPVHDWPVAQASPSGLCVINDVIFMASLRGARLWRMPIDGSDVSDVKAYFVGTYGRLRTVIPAPDGSLWMTTSNHDSNGRPRTGDDRILRVELE